MYVGIGIGIGNGTGIGIGIGNVGRECVVEWSGLRTNETNKWRIEGGCWNGEMGGFFCYRLCSRRCM